MPKARERLAQWLPSKTGRDLALAAPTCLHLHIDNHRDDLHRKDVVLLGLTCGGKIKHLPHSKNFRFNSDSSLVNKERGRGHEQNPSLDLRWQGALKNDHVATRGGKSSRSHIFERNHWIKSQGDLLTFDILHLVHESQHFLCCYGGGTTPLISSLQDTDGFTFDNAVLAH